MARESLWGRIGVWLRRYGPAELLGTAAALLAATIAHALTGSAVAAAVAANWAEGLLYYGWLFARDLRAAGPPTARSAAATLRAMALEFGLAEILSLVLVRNVTLYAGIASMPSLGMGVLAGKGVADLLFYLPTIISYELLRGRVGRGRATL